MRRRYQEGGLAAGADPNDDTDDDQTAMGLGGDDDSDEQPAGAVTASGGLTALDIPGAQEAFTLMAKSSEQARQALQQARESIMQRHYSKADALLAASAALGAPTRSGSTAESFGAMAGALRGPLAARQQFDIQKQKDLLGVNTQLAGLDDRQATAQLALAQLRAKLQIQAANAPNDRVVLPDGTVEFRTHAAARVPGTKAYTPPEPPGEFTIVQQPMPDGTIQPTKLNHRTGATTPVGDAYTPITKLSATALAQAKGKLQTVQILKEQLADIRDKWEPLKDSFSAGKYQGWWPSETGSNFDKAVNAARGTIRQLTRVPGEGSMSDWEGKLDQAKLPDRNDYESTTEQSMDQLEKLLRAYERTTKDMIGIKPIEDVADKPSTVAPSKKAASPEAEADVNPDDTAPARAPPEAEKDIRANPTDRNKRFFIKKYGYLPDGIPL